MNCLKKYGMKNNNIPYKDRNSTATLTPLEVIMGKHRRIEGTNIDIYQKETSKIRTIARLKRVLENMAPHSKNYVDGDLVFENHRITLEGEYTAKELLKVLYEEEKKM